MMIEFIDRVLRRPLVCRETMNQHVNSEIIKNMNIRRDGIVSYMKKHGNVSVKQLMDFMDEPKKNIVNDLEALVDFARVSKIKKSNCVLYRAVM